jgi:hypothetical protein
MIMTLLGAMEFKHSIIRVALRRVLVKTTCSCTVALGASSSSGRCRHRARDAALSGARIVLLWLLRGATILATAVRDPQADVG